jgi:hypothetical protein
VSPIRDAEVAPRSVAGARFIKLIWLRRLGYEWVIFAADLRFTGSTPNPPHVASGQW